MKLNTNTILTTFSASGGGSFIVRGADWEYRISGGRGLGGSPPDAEAISAFMWLKVHQNQHLGVI